MLKPEQIEKFNRVGLRVTVSEQDTDKSGYLLAGAALENPNHDSVYALWAQKSQNQLKTFDDQMGLREPEFAISKEADESYSASLTHMLWDANDPSEVATHVSLDAAIDYICTRYQIYQNRLYRCGNLDLQHVFPDYNLHYAYKILVMFFNSTNVKELEGQIVTSKFGIEVGKLLKVVSRAIGRSLMRDLERTDLDEETLRFNQRRHEALNNAHTEQDTLKAIKKYLFDEESVPPKLDLSGW